MPSTGGNLLGTQTTDARGAVVGGPVYANTLNWWQINYAAGVDGWSVEDFLTKVAVSSGGGGGGSSSGHSGGGGGGGGGSSPSPVPPGCTSTTLFSPVTGAKCPSSGNGTPGVGSKVKTSTIVNVRGTPSTTGVLQGAQATGAQGTIVAGPISANGYTWWQINYNAGADGWSVSSFLTIDAASFTPTYYPPSSGTLLFPGPMNLADRTVVMALQTVLNKALHWNLVVDGVNGKGTLSAVKAFQASVGLTADGVIGPATRARLNAVQ